MARSLCLAVLLVSTIARADTDDPRKWVARMNEAVSGRNYDGVFVHELGAMRETLRIIHRVKGGRMTERLVSTDGSGREFVRNGHEWIAYFPDRRIVVVDSRRDSGFIASLPGLVTGSTDNYEIRDEGRVRLQGTTARLIAVTPRDSFRYGYRLWIDEKTGMPLKTQLSSVNNDVIERITFVSLSLPAQVDDELLKPDVDASGFHWLRRDKPVVAMPLERTFAPNTSSLPPGFQVRKWGHASDSSKELQSHFVFSDGLAWVSAFVERNDQPPALSHDGTPRRLDGPVQMGTSAAFTTRIEGYRVTAVGEVPMATVKAISESVKPE
jgi:sigma-E factor negative regulatory protein RseB